ncbi:phage tail assembly chaperone [Pseudomonas sp. 13B_2.1_Bac1]|uniref:phage tail assembly chaperone n=1 Tax=Pseudomonas sp. 13B_2.1_Bac1 TaxID=2971624 RepID=UPI0021C5FB60|nr:phage tail assembly chaperone [Pseudomonas sp. 13B_2.1_Bac1]MCU1781152.1 phage tail assembly chaperone [Pseudomonas sp. 13B_2.1_Bac1]
MKVSDLNWIPPDIQVPNPAWVEGDGSVPETISAPDVDATPPMIDTPDVDAVQPIITVPNPACLLPPAAELVEITQEDHDAIFRAVSTGKSTFRGGKDGRPIIIATPGLTLEELEYSERAFRDKTLLLTDTLVARHRDELEAERATTLTTEQYKQLQGYRQDLRDWPESAHFPALEYRPEQPAWLAELIL